MKLEVGMYVRTKKGIAKIIGRVSDPTNYYDKCWICDRYLELNDETRYIREYDIIGEPKEELIDLIEVGDYVNGGKVLEKKIEWIEFYDVDKLTYLYIVLDGKKELIYEKDIKSIVTKEMFESMKYEVK